MASLPIATDWFAMVPTNSGFGLRKSLLNVPITKTLILVVNFGKHVA